MLRRAKISLSLGLLIVSISCWKLLPAFGQDVPVIQELTARGRVFPDAGPGVLAIKRDSNGRYFILAAPANTVAVYSPEGKRAGQIPNANSASSKITYAEDIDLDANGRLYVADRGANAVKIYDPDGTSAGMIAISAPTSVVALSGRECAVVSLRSGHLVDIFDANGQPVRSFGELADLGGPVDNHGFTPRGRLATDPAGHVYFALAYLPVPAIRKYDRYGFAAYEVPLFSSAPSAHGPQDQRGMILMEKRGDVPEAKPVINAFGIDPVNQEIWAAIGDSLIAIGQRR